MISDKDIERLPKLIKSATPAGYALLKELLEDLLKSDIKILCELKKLDDFRYYQGRISLLQQLLKWWDDTYER